MSTRRRRFLAAAAAAAVFAALTTACNRDKPDAAPVTGPVLSPAAADKATLSGSGSTFVQPLLQNWVTRYKAVAPGVTINYGAGGSGAALDAYKAGGGDFFATDVPLSDIDVATSGGTGAFVEVPWAAGAIALAYNLPGVVGLRLTPADVADIFAGRIQRWDDPILRNDNPDAKLPSMPIQVVFRSDASGTTNVFSAYLKAASAGEWPLGTGFTVAFPRGSGAKGSAAVAAAVKAGAGAIGYVSLAQAKAASLAVALLRNEALQYVGPTTQAVNAAIDSAVPRPSGTTASLNFTPASPGAYPLATLSYLLFHRNQLAPGSEAALRHFAAWAISQGQRDAEPLGYVPLPDQFATPALRALEQA